MGRTISNFSDYVSLVSTDCLKPKSRRADKRPAGLLGLDKFSVIINNSDEKLICKNCIAKSLKLCTQHRHTKAEKHGIINISNKKKHASKEEFKMKKYKVEFTYQDRNTRGLHFKNAKRAVKAASEEDAIKKIEAKLYDRIYDPKVTEIAE